MTGAQLIYATYRMQAQNYWRLLRLSVFSLAVVVFGYTLISHAFNLFLYPDEAFRERIYAAANMDLLRFDILVGLMTALIVAGWLVTYYAEQSGSRLRGRAKWLWLTFYAFISRELYLPDLFTRLTRLLLRTAGQLNVWLRWV
jgi:NADH-quinone oxidoreductase subunit L